MAEYVKLYRKYEQAKKAADAKSEELGSLIHQIATKHLPPMMEKEETDDKNFPGVGRIELRQEVYVHVKKDEKPALYQTLRDEGHGDLIVEYIFPQTLKAFAEEQLALNKALPPTLKATFIPTAKLLKAKANKRNK